MSETCQLPHLPIFPALIRISQMFCDYFHLDLVISSPPRVQGNLLHFHCLATKDWEGERVFFLTKDKAAMISLLALFL